MSLKDKLNRLKGHLSLDTESLKQTGIEVSSNQLEIPFLDKWKAVQAKPFGTDDDYVFVREVRYPITHRHGNYAFDQFQEIIRAWEQSGIDHPLSVAGHSVEDLLFFDTETTGLHGGTGNTIFLLGYSRFEQDSVVVRQHFLAEPHAEATLYQSFLHDIKESKHLVTYNGKSFDWPQVKTRHTLVRDFVPELPTFGHYDLLHGARRLWKQDLESCRLSIIEKEKLGIYRHNDVPGSMAPILYFDYLSNRDPDTVHGVLHHNEIDVLSLITLYIHVSKLLLNHWETERTIEEQFAIARWYEALGVDDAAFEGYGSIAESNHALSDRAKIALGHMFKKQKAWQQALKQWEDVVNRPTYIPEEIYIEIAKIYEHQMKEYDKALHYALQAFDMWKKRGALLRRKSKAEKESFEKRIERLENRAHAQCDMGSIFSDWKDGTSGL